MSLNTVEIADTTFVSSGRVQDTVERTRTAVK